MLLVAAGIVVTVAVVVGIVALWPSGSDTGAETAAPSTTRGQETATTGAGEGEPARQSTTSEKLTKDPAPEVVDLFTSGAPEVLAELSSAAGNPTQALEVLVYPDYALLAYRDPAQPANIDQRMWRDGEVGPAAPNPTDDRVDADTEPDLFDLAALDLGVLASLTADASARFDLDVEVSHVIIDRFLPFDDRVLIRVYASPTDGRSGGGYVQYTLDGTFVETVQ